MSLSPVTIGLSRQEQVQQAVTNWYTNFEGDFSPQFSEKDFLATYHRNIEWVDHPFQIRRIGHTAVLGLRKAFLHCNQPFRSELKALIPTSEGAVVEMLWIGRCANDIIRPDGEVAVKASGKDFENHVCFVIKIDDGGRITRIDEYYNKAWDNGIQEDKYTVMRGGSLKL